MDYKIINMETYPRRKHFEYFLKLGFPYLGLTADIDVTEVRRFNKRTATPFYLTMVNILARAANRIPELRQRIRDGGIVEYPVCGTSQVELLDDGTFCYCRLAGDKPFAEFIDYARAEQTRCRLVASIEEDGDPDSLFFISAIPWVHYTSLAQALPCNQESNPRITIGRYDEKDGRIMMPLTLNTHHALVDGLHAGLFYKYVEEEIKSFSSPV